MLPLTEIIALLEARQKADSTIEGSALLALAMHLKNLENQLVRLEAQCNPKT